MVLWGGIVAFVVVSVLGLVVSIRVGSGQINRLATVLAIAIVIFIVGAAYYFGMRVGVQKARRESRFLLTDTELIRKREGWPDRRIGLSEIRALYDGPSLLIVEGAAASSRIAVPKQIEGFDTLQSQLKKHATIVTTTSPSLLNWIQPLVTVVSWAFFLWSHDARVVQGAGIIVAVSTGWLFLNLSKRLGQVSKRRLIQVWLAASWLMVLWIIYSRLHKF